MLPANKMNLIQNQHGQAAVLGVISLIVLVIGMYTTFSLGRAVSDKIYLQNVADTTAYSMAVSEARTFNFIAFANRCMVAHYAFLASYQSLGPYMYSHAMEYNFMAVAVDRLFSAGEVLTHLWWVPYGVGEALAEVGRIVKNVAKPLAQGIDKISKIFQKIGDVIDGVSMGIYPVMIMMNWIYWFACWAMSIATFSLLADDGFNEITLKNDPTIKRHGIGIALGALSAFKFNNTFDPRGGAPLPFTLDGFNASLAFPKLGPTAAKQKKDDVKPLQVLMTEMVNATRQNNQTIDRRWGDGLQSAANGFADSLGEARDRANNVNTDNDDGQEALETIGEVMNAVRNISPKRGQTKFLTHENNMSKSKVQSALMKVKNTTTGEGNFSRGTALVASDYLLGIQRTAMGVYADVDGSYRCYHEHQDIKLKERLLLVTAVGDRIERLVVEGKILAGSYIKCEKFEGNKKFYYLWKGIQPYMKFLPKSDDPDFNQPDTWVWLHRDEGDGDGPELNIDMKIGNAHETFNSDKEHGDIFKGINVLARGQAYYHRPKNWKEQPNFFNPFWRARLAPVGDKLSQWLSKIPIDMNPTIENMLTHGVITH